MVTPQGSRRSGWLPAAIGLVVALPVLITTLYFVISSHVPGPLSDFWTFLPTLEAFDRGDNIFPALLEPHGGHRLFFPRLLHLIEYFVFDGQNVFGIAMGLLFQAGTVALLLTVFVRERAMLGAGSLVFLAALAVALFFSSTQIRNFSQPWNLCYFLGNLSATISFWALLHAAAKRKEGRGWLALALTAATVSSYSTAHGLAAWPTLAMLGYALRLAPARLAAIAGVGTAVTAAFFFGYEGASDASLTQIVAHPQRFVGGIGLLLGIPLSRTHSGFGTTLGLLGMASAGALLIHLVATRPIPRRAEGLALALLSFSAASVVLIALGRGGMRANWWVPMRYQTYALPFWWSLIAVCTLRATGSRGWQRGLRTGLVAVVALWAIGVIVPAHLAEGFRQVKRAEARQLAGLALVVGIEGRHATQLNRPRRDRRGELSSVAPRLPFLRKKRLGLFGGGVGDLFGQRIGTQLAIADSGPCTGGVNRSIHLDPDDASAARLSGWLVDPGLGTRLGTVLVTDATRTVIGLGRAWRPLPAWLRAAEPLARHPRLGKKALRKSLQVAGNRALSWDAYVKPRSEDDAYEIWIVPAGGSACPIEPPG